MATNDDVFGSLNSFLGKGDDSYAYDVIDMITPDTSFVPSTVKSSGSENITVDLTDFDFTMPRRSGRSSKRGSSSTPDASFDLTDGSFEVSPPKRSRRAADEIQADVLDSIQLGEEDEIDNASCTAAVPKKRGRPSRKCKESFKVPEAAKLPVKVATTATPPVKAKKGPKPKRVTYKQALALAKAPIPSLSGESPANKKKKSPETAQRKEKRSSQQSKEPTCDIDLTGDIVLTDKHSSAPLFQSSNLPKKKVVETDESSDDDIMNFDVDAIKVKVKTSKGIKSFSHLNHQRFYDIYKKISDQENIPVCNIFLYNGDKRVQPDDTPVSANIKISTILDCRVMECKPGEYQITNKKDQIELKFQSDKWKKPIAVKISKFDVLKTAIGNLCEKMPEFKPHQFSLQFDGDAIDVNDTPTDLEFEGGEILDCRVKV